MKLVSPHHVGIRGVLCLSNFYNLIIAVLWEFCAYQTVMTSSLRYRGSFVPIKLLSPHHVGIRGVLCLSNFYDLIIAV